MADVNGDGLTEMVVVATPNRPSLARYVCVGLSNGTGFNVWTWNYGARMVEDGAGVYMADVNGDGKSDMVVVAAPNSPSLPGDVDRGSGEEGRSEDWAGRCGVRMKKDGAGG